jgi:hypothetical protein
VLIHIYARVGLVKVDTESTETDDCIYICFHSFGFYYSGVWWFFGWCITSLLYQNNIHILYYVIKCITIKNITELGKLNLGDVSILIKKK